MPQKFKIELTKSWQVEDHKGCYIATTYSRHDAVLAAKLARSIKGKVVGLCPHQIHLKQQPKGFYQYKGKGKKAYPFLESYDERLDKLVWKNRRKFIGEQ